MVEKWRCVTPVAIIVAQQPTQAISTPHLIALAPHAWLWCDELIAETLMIPLVVIIRQVRLEDVAKGRFSNHVSLLQSFLFDRAHEPFAVGIEIRTPWRQDDGLNAAGAQHPVEAMHKIFVSGMKQIPFAPQEAIKGIGHLPGTLHHAGVRRMRGEARKMHPPRGQFQHQQHIVGHQAVPRRHLHGEEVRRREDLPVQLEKLSPAHAGLASSGRWVEVVATQDVPHRDRVNVMPQVRQGTLNASIAPSKILLGHADHELFDLLRHTRAAKVAAVAAPVELLCDETGVPTHEGAWSGHRGDLFQARATDRVCERREAAAFSVCQVQPATAKLGFENAVFREEISDDLLLVTWDPPGEHGAQHLQDHGLSSGVQA
jgi:hypothetical protein